MNKLWAWLTRADKISELNRTIDIYKEHSQQLESELSALKDIKLKHDVLKLYVDDDEALLDLYDTAKRADAFKGAQQSADLGYGQLADMAARQQLCGYGQSLMGLSGAAGLIGSALR